MAKRRPIVDQDYSPVRAKLSQYRESAARPAAERHAVEPAPVVETEPPVVEAPPVETTASTAGAVPERVETIPTAPAQDLTQKPDLEVVPPLEISPALRNAMTKELRARCTDEEHEEWHDFAQEVTGKRNNFSAIFRACLSLLEHATGELEIRKPQMKSLKRPPKGKHLETALYEHQLSLIVYDALRAAGRPKDRIIANEPGE